MCRHSCAHKDTTVTGHMWPLSTEHTLWHGHLRVLPGSGGAAEGTGDLPPSCRDTLGPDSDSRSCAFSLGTGCGHWVALMSPWAVMQILSRKESLIHPADSSGRKTYIFAGGISAVRNLVLSLPVHRKWLLNVKQNWGQTGQVSLGCLEACILCAHRRCGIKLHQERCNFLCLGSSAMAPVSSAK